ncbi:subunit mu of clathrin/coatomer adator AP-2 complex [Chloropicon primus]|uniref:Subunit mu of clathrin/coatomer adator AP-2 complex n=1 Tax=Chloropicon primus TaxID=1764295 RepID=A0A5B8MYS1_9CHLO|nr:subunit mu of clathrin/coatomer adator AP-2 complex [Chloropicon primus]UPR03990.1 subunit mu of clathrin/coatomer adator AP-2 complex [Chloropicon primus]|eukprot:QDZ24782.1 subunit mu of clathrin/coatomer adator AP-2 complex [Chloropicon primus]
MAAPALDALYFLDGRGNVIMSRTYREGMGRDMAEVFKKSILENPQTEGTAPVKNLGSCNFLYVKVTNVYVLAVTNKNAHAAMCLNFISDMIRLMRGYFGNFNEDAIRNNFVLVYELLDEIMDFGYPQILNEQVLKTYITQKGTKVDAGTAVPTSSSVNMMQVTGAVAHRREGIKYKRNEVYLDVIEDVNVLIGQQGSVLKADVQGAILVKSFLSGMPSLKIGLNEAAALQNDTNTSGQLGGRRKIDLDDIVFHQCVNLTKFNSERMVTFTPPDGEFQLMKYRASENLHIPFKVFPNIKDVGRSRIEVRVTIKSLYASKLMAMRCLVKIPVPKYTAKARFDMAGGKCKYDAASNMLIWKLKRFPGGQSSTLFADVELVSTLKERKAWVQPPIQLDFNIPMYTSSGMQVLYLKVWEKSGYETTKWVRKLTKAGDFSVRCT